MKSNEFQKWFGDLKLRFPDSAAWIAKGDRSETEQLGILKQWADALADVDLADALEVNARIHRGQIMLDDNRPGFPAYERENIPGIVRRHATGLRMQRTIGSPRPETWRECVKCKPCGDSGFRPVWTNRAIAYMREHQNLDGFGPHRHVMARCNCERGFPRGKEPHEVKPGDNSRVESVPRFTEQGFCEVVAWDTRSDVALGHLSAWIAEYDQRRIESAYGGDFADWNQAAGRIQ